jgi:putative alpha-1,2-mannosidase
MKSPTLYAIHSLTLMFHFYYILCSVGSYHQEIHEMTEMRSLAMGQYGHNNQPSHHILYLYALLGDRKATEKYVREVINRGYGEDFYAGACLN